MNMKSSGFRQQSKKEIQEKRDKTKARRIASLKEKQANRVSKPKANKKSVGGQNKPLRARSKLPTVKTMRNKCDKLLTPIIKVMHPYCFLGASQNCQSVTQVAHHHVLKSQCTNLRYDIDNLIPLCSPCHMMLHSHETYWSSVIVEQKGMGWWLPLKAKKPIMVKADVHFYIENYERLSKILEDLKRG